MKASRRKKAAALQPLSAAQRRRLERREQLLERYEVTSQTFADALAVLQALNCWVKDTATTAVKAMAARDRAKAALDAHLTKAIAAAGKERRTAGLNRMVAVGERLGPYDDGFNGKLTLPDNALMNELHKSSAKAGTAVDKALAFVKQSKRCTSKWPANGQAFFQ